MYLCYCGKNYELYYELDVDIIVFDLKKSKIVGYDDLFVDEKKLIFLFSRYDFCLCMSEGILVLVLIGNYIGLMVDSYVVFWLERGLICFIDKF